jgi:nucleoside-diphosphate-sugar epimerase
MKILLTGISGRVGRVCAADFLDNGHEVRGFDRHPVPADLRPRVEMLYGEVTDRIAMLRAAEGCDAVCHLAAIPNPGSADDVLFPINVTGTQYALAAAEAHGIQKFALASTCCTFGLVFAKHDFDPAYLPMDEKHPTLTQDIYGLSKLLNEETCAMYTRRTGMTTVALRLTTVTNLSRMAEHRWGKRRLLDSDTWRASDLWTYIDDRDTARAFRLSLENAPTGAHVAIIAARDSLTPFDLRDLVCKHFPSLAEYADKLNPHGSAYDTSAAERIFGFVAQHSWRDIPSLREAADEVLAGRK